MNRLFIPPSDLKSYCRLLKKHNYRNPIPHLECLGVIVKALGFDHYTDYDDFANKSAGPSLSVRALHTRVPEELPLNELIDWSNRIAEDLVSKLGAIVPEIEFYRTRIPSTPLVRHIERQIEHLDQLPALRMSGALYLLGLLTDHNLFDPHTWTINGQDLLAILKTRGAVPEILQRRMGVFFDRNMAQELRYHEGVLCEVQGAMRKGLLSDREAVQLIQDTLEEEIRYLSAFMLKPKTPQFNLPVYQDPRRGKSQGALTSLIRSLTSHNKPLLLGREAHSRVLARCKTATLTPEQMRAGIIITGAAGSGRSYSTLYLAKQAIMNNGGLVCVLGSGDPSFLWQLKALCRHHGRENDFVALTLRHKNEIHDLDLGCLREQNKIVCLMLPALEKDPQSLIQGILPVFHRLSASSGTVHAPSHYFPYCVILSDLSLAYRDEKAFPVVIDAIDRMKAGRMAVITSEQDLALDQGKKKALLARFNTRVIMRSECSDGLPVRMASSEARSIARMREGEFRILRATGRADRTVYQFPYSEPKLPASLYLVMS